MKPLQPDWEIYEFQHYFFTRYKNTAGSERGQTHKTMEDALKHIQSFYEKRREPRVLDFKKSNSENARHPYDRDDDYWEGQEGMTTTTKLELNDDETN